MISDDDFRALVTLIEDGEVDDRMIELIAAVDERNERARRKLSFGYWSGALVACARGALDRTLIPLCRKNGSVRAFALIGEEDYEQVSSHKWSWSNGYAVAANGRRMIKMHRQVLGLTCDDGLQVDHVRAGFTLDNRRHNLRVATNAQNAQNRKEMGGSSSYRGVCWRKDTHKWMAYMTKNYKRVYLGVFDSEDEAGRIAAEARREAMPFSSESAHV